MTAFRLSDSDHQHGVEDGASHVCQLA